MSHASASSLVRRVLAAALVMAPGAFAVTSAAADETPLPPLPPSEPAPASTTEGKPEPAPVAPSFKTSIGNAVAIRGTLPKNVGAAFKALAPAVDACYREAIAHEGETEGSLELRLELVGPGRVASATVNASKEISSALRGCIRDAFAGVPAAGIGESPVEALLGITFDREVPEDATRPASACPESCEGEMTDELRGAVRERAMRAAFCFKRGAAAGEPATLKAGQLDVHLRIAGDGSVCGVSMSNDQFGRPSLTSCIMETMSGALSAKPLGCVDVNVPMVFKGT